MLEKCEDLAPGLTLWADPDQPEDIHKRGIYTTLNEKIRNDTRLRRIELGIKAPTSSKFYMTFECCLAIKLCLCDFFREGQGTTTRTSQTATSRPEQQQKFS